MTKAKNKRFIYLKILVFNILIIFFLLEVLLCTSLGNKLNVTNDYIGSFNPNFIRWHGNLIPFDTIRYYSPNEFDILYRANNEGLRDNNFKIEKRKFRILTLGDSFTECVGAENEYTWQNQLINILPDSIKTKLEIFNAGIGGSDPIFALELYKNKLQKYNPDFIILTINDSDIIDVAIRGGKERFIMDELKYKQPPKWKFIL